MQINKIQEFPDGHFEVNITFANNENKTIGIPKKTDVGLTKKQHIQTELQKIKNASNEQGPTDITGTIGPITLT